MVPTPYCDRLHSRVYIPTDDERDDESDDREKTRKTGAIALKRSF